MFKWFDNLKLQPKFLSLFAALIIILAASTTLYIFQMVEMNSLLDEAELNSSRAQTLSKLEARLAELVVDVKAYLADAPNPTATSDTAAAPAPDIEPKLNGIQNLDLSYIIGDTYQIKPVLIQLKAMLADAAGSYPERTALVNDLDTSVNKLFTEISKLAGHNHFGETDEALAAANSLIAPDSLLMQAQDSAGKLHDWVDYATDTINQRAARTQSDAIYLAASMIVLVLGLAFVTALATTNVSQPLLYLTNAIFNFQSGTYRDDLLKGYETRRDEVGQLISAFNGMVESITEANKRRERLLQSASRFIPQAYLNFLHKDSVTDINLGDNVAANMAVMFSDIRGFTTMSEGMSAQENFDFINEFFLRVSPAIEDHSGFIVKFLGDGMMALFPYGVEYAIEAGLEKQRTTHDLTREMNARGHAGTLNLGVGIHVGAMTVGMIGEHDRLQGDAFSDNVNLTSRVESLNKTFGTNMIITEEARQKLADPDKYAMRPLGNVQVKGREGALVLHEIFETDPDDLRKAKIATLKEFEKGLVLYINGQFAESKKAFEAVLKQNKADRTAQFYIEILTDLIAQGKPKHWDGAVVMTTK
jgi:class 3 adenylate cyclase